MWTTIAAVAVPIILAVAGFVGSGGTRLSKRIAHHADLIGKLEHAPEAKAALCALMVKEVSWLDEDETRKRTMPFEWRPLRASLIWAVVTFAFSFSAVSVAISAREADEPLILLSNVCYVLGGLAAGACGAFVGNTVARFL